MIGTLSPSDGRCRPPSLFDTTKLIPFSSRIMCLRWVSEGAKTKILYDLHRPRALTSGCTPHPFESPCLYTVTRRNSRRKHNNIETDEFTKFKTKIKKKKKKKPSTTVPSACNFPIPYLGKNIGFTLQLLIIIINNYSIIWRITDVCGKILDVSTCSIFERETV